MLKKLLAMLAACLAFAGVAFAAGQVNLNTASEAELQTVKGIGPAKARAIVEYRTRKGRFEAVDELDNVPGFGIKTVDRVRPFVTVSGAGKSAEPGKGEAKPAAPKGTKKSLAR
jgi:competence protein ComEA